MNLTVPIINLGSFEEVSLVQSILSSENIASHIPDSHSNTVMPYMQIANMGFWLLVQPKDEILAREILIKNGYSPFFPKEKNLEEMIDDATKCWPFLGKIPPIMRIIVLIFGLALFIGILFTII